MLQSIKDLFQAALLPPAPSPDGDRRDGDAAPSRQLATAVLLVEVMRADSALEPAERNAVIGVLQRRFGLADDAVAQLLALAEREQGEATDFLHFTSALHDTASDAEKLAIVEAMWEVAFADKHLETHEQHVLWRVADLLHVPHGAYIHAKMRARAAAGVPPEAL